MKSYRTPDDRDAYVEPKERKPMKGTTKAALAIVAALFAGLILVVGIIASIAWFGDEAEKDRKS